MDNTATISLQITGEETGDQFVGDFVVKTLLTRKDVFEADRIRRTILGPSPDGTPPAPALQAEAYMLGQLRVRILSSPPWWERSTYGIELLDQNVVTTLFELAMSKEEERRKSVIEAGTAATKELRKKKTSEG